MKKIVFGINVNFFTDNKDISIEPHSISRYMDALSKFGLIPSFGSEFNPANNEKRNFLRMVSSDEAIQVNFGSGATNISIRDNDNIPSVCEFLELLFNELGRMTPHKKASRLSVITSSLVKGSSEEYDGVFANIFSPHDGGIFEWDYRVARKINLHGVEDGMNLVSTCRRGMNGAVGGDIVDSIVLDTDLNTQFENQTQRYSYALSIPCLLIMLKEVMTVHTEFMDKRGLTV